jgi:hypothetical protein
MIHSNDEGASSGRFRFICDQKHASVWRRRRLTVTCGHDQEREIPRMREENPGLKLSQIKERIFNEWQKSPENPVNQQ